MSGMDSRIHLASGTRVCKSEMPDTRIQFLQCVLLPARGETDQGQGGTVGSQLPRTKLILIYFRTVSGLNGRRYSYEQFIRNAPIPS